MPGVGLAFVGALKSVPRFVWYALAAALVFAFAVHWYNGKIDAAEKRGADAAYAHIADKAREIERQANDLAAKISEAFRRKNDEEARAIARAADAVLMRGPGKAACSSVAGVPTLSSRPQPASGPADAPLDQVPSGARTDLIALPFAPTVAFGREHDLNRSELLTCRAAWQRLSAEWEALRNRSDLASARDSRNGNNGGGG